MSQLSPPHWLDRAMLRDRQWWHHLLSTGHRKKSIMMSHSHALQPVFGWELLTSGALENNAHGHAYSRTTTVR